jgi:hypothetical protein
MVGRRSPLHEDRQIPWLQLDRPLWPTYCGHHAAENEVTYGAHNLEQHQVASSDFDTERNYVAYGVSNAQQKQLVHVLPAIRGPRALCGSFAATSSPSQRGLTNLLRRDPTSSGRSCPESIKIPRLISQPSRIQGRCVVYKQLPTRRVSPQLA